ncbi:MAG: hypothetical protein IPI25_04065 [Candidatus Brocadia sp.]|nr:MAG: hypothetical protein IPI25_04065 [Candidatus Brocadia sp.]
MKGEIKQMREIVAENSYFVGIKFSHFFSNQEYACSMPARKDDKESLERWLKIVATGNN